MNLLNKNRKNDLILRIIENNIIKTSVKKKIKLVTVRVGFEPTVHFKMNDGLVDH